MLNCNSYEGTERGVVWQRGFKVLGPFISAPESEPLGPGEGAMRLEARHSRRSLVRRGCSHSVLVLVLVASLASCSLDDRVRDAPLDRTEASVVSARCPSKAKDVEDFSVPGLPSGAAPANFEAKRVLQCSVESNDQGNGKMTYVVTVSDGAMTADLQAALQLPDQEFVHPENGVCSADAILMPLLLLSDGSGRAYRPRLPLTACSKPRPELLRALNDLSLNQTDRYVLTGPTPR